jgi:hypothetical protein
MQIAGGSVAPLQVVGVPDGPVEHVQSTDGTTDYRLVRAGSVGQGRAGSVGQGRAGVSAFNFYDMGQLSTTSFMDQMKSLLKQQQTRQP